jgi:MoaA/NifB/PqqE/SkfB family radical SAM enzyme
LLKNYCPEIYRSIFVDRHNDDFIRVAPCCQATSNIEPVSTFNFATSPYLTQLRNEFNLGKRPEACARCWSAEELGHKSRRQSAIEFFENQTTEIKLESIDHSATWACNLACIMCAPHSSSLWAAQENLSKHELAQLGRQFQKSNNFLHSLDVTHVKKIHFNGGEPMLNNDQTNLLLKLEQQGVLKNVFISYNTNGTVMPGKKVIDLWSKARLVKIFFSIDAIGSAFEYIRWPGKWEQTSKNILDMKANLPSNVMFGFNTTVGSYNLLELVEVYKWFEQNLKYNREGDESDFCWQLANNFDIKYLSATIKLKAIQQMDSIMPLNGIVNYLKSTINHNEDLSWIKTLSQLDIKRNTDWKNSLKVSELIEDTKC